MTLHLDRDRLDPTFSVENRLLALAHALEQCSAGGMAEALRAEVARRWARLPARYIAAAVAMCNARRKELAATQHGDPARPGKE